MKEELVLQTVPAMARSRSSWSLLEDGLSGGTVKMEIARRDIWPIPSVHGSARSTQEAAVPCSEDSLNMLHQQCWIRWSAPVDVLILVGVVTLQQQGKLLH